MSQEIYIVNAFPGTVGHVVAGLIHRHYLEAGRPIIRGDFSFDDPTPELQTADWFYDHLVINLENTASHIVDIPYTPNFEKIKTKYPTAKTVVITHSLEDCISMATAVFQHYYVYGWSSGLYTDLFRNLISNHSQFFPNLDITPAELTVQQKRIVLSLIQNQAVLAGFHNVNIPTDDPNIVAIKYHEMIYQPEIFKEKLTSILGEPIQQAVITDYKGFLQSYHGFVYNRYKYQYEST